MAELKDKIVLVTGAAGAIGSAIAAAVKAACGTPIASDLAGRPGIDMALDVTSEENWQRVAGEIEQKHGRSTAWSMRPASPPSAMSRRPISHLGGAC